MEDVTRVTYAILLSSRTHLNVSQLDKEFNDVEGKRIPYRNLGFNSIEQFLRSVPERFLVIGSGLNANVWPIVGKDKGDICGWTKIPFNRKLHARNMNYITSISKMKLKDKPKKPAETGKENSTIDASTSKAQKFSKVQSEEVIDSDVSSSRSTLQEITMNSKKINDRLTSDAAVARGFGRGICKYSKQNRTSHSVIDGVDKNQTLQIRGQTYYFSDNELSVDDETHNENEDQGDKYIDGLMKKFGLAAVRPAPLSSHNTNKKHVEENNLMKFEEKEAVPLYAIDAAVFEIDIPKDTVHFNENFRQIPIDEDLLQAITLSVRITEIYSPFQMWFQLVDESDRLSNLMAELNRVYKDLAGRNTRVIPSVLIRPGQICAAKIKKTWYRSKILETFTKSHCIKVFCFDYGTVATVRDTNMKFLFKEFLDEPAFIHRGCIALIRPRETHWPKNATFFFQEFVHSKVLHARILDYDADNDIYYVELYDYDDSMKLRAVHNQMCLEGYAERNEFWNEEAIARMNGKRIQLVRENYPTFDMLESGVYPTFKEICAYLENGLDYEAYYDKLFYNFEKYRRELNMKQSNPFFKPILSRLLMYDSIKFK